VERLDDKKYRRHVRISLLAMTIAAAGALLQIGGANWDVTSHWLNESETFFKPEHAVLYSGVALGVIAAGMGGVLLLRNRDLRNRSFSTAFKFFLVGAVLQLVAGQFDFWWHENFGFDGLLSPPHLTLNLGMILYSVGATLGITRLASQVAFRPKLVKVTGILAFAGLCLNSIGIVYMFVLPVSKGEHFNFNPDPIAAGIIAMTAMPLVISMTLLTSYRVFPRFGVVTAVAMSVLLAGALTTIVPMYGRFDLLAFYPVVVLPVILAVIAADFVMNHLRKPPIGNAKLQIAGGAIMGSVFLLFCPLLVVPLALFLGIHGSSYAELFVNSLGAALPLTMMIGSIMGTLGAFIVRRIGTPAEVIVDIGE
jgi:hypothetical protein